MVSLHSARSPAALEVPVTTTLTRSEQLLRQMFKYGNRFMLPLWRLGLGNFGNRPETSQVMVLVHTGRKTGLQRHTPVNYAMVEGEVYCAAAFGVAADWYRNIMANPQVEVWLREGWWAGVAEEVPAGDPSRNPMMRQVLMASGFAAPLFAGFNPKNVDDQELGELTASYRLIRIRRTHALTGPGGPGDLAWVWPLATQVLVLLLLLSCRRARGRPSSSSSRE